LEKCPKHPLPCAGKGVKNWQNQRPTADKSVATDKRNQPTTCWQRNTCERFGQHCTRRRQLSGWDQDSNPRRFDDMPDAL